MHHLSSMFQFHHQYTTCIKCIRQCCASTCSTCQINGLSLKIKKNCNQFPKYQPQKTYRSIIRPCHGLEVLRRILSLVQGPTSESATPNHLLWHSSSIPSPEASPYVASDVLKVPYRHWRASMSSGCGIGKSSEQLQGQDKLCQPEVFGPMEHPT
jgi:hypothetical protein